MFASLLTYGLFATAAFARPSPGLSGRLARRAGAHQGGVKIPSNGPASLTNITHAETSSNWAGAAFESPAVSVTYVLCLSDCLINLQGTYKSVTGTFVVPTPKVPTGSSSSGSFAASAWVGIDGDTCGTAILQTGIDFTVSGGRVSYDGGYSVM